MDLESIIIQCNFLLNKIPFGPLVVYFCRFYYFVLITAVIITYAFPILREHFIVFGKLLNNPKKLIHVPKKWFTYFYIVGLIWSIYLLIEYNFYLFKPSSKLPLLQLISKYWDYNLNINMKSLVQFNLQENNESFTFKQLPLESLIILVLMTFHMLRRTLESFYVTKFSDAKMHFGHFLVGITFYIFTSFSIVIESINNNIAFSFKDINACHVLGIILCIFAQSQQYWCHKFLASLRPDVSPGDKNIKAVYQLPCRRWFNLVDSPQYLFEIVIYFSFYIISIFKNQTLLFVVVWTIVNLGVTAYGVHDWYMKKFKDNYPKNRKRIIPFIF
ncbi:hypothetical protein BCR36DRAFT_334567 [Piromyces finnis]|uniref:3-oxo-5-alpha-steroid 4-dehydrogenase C-terminal domain-containing protein n=1 Tax=Piromyces finnis TaxID=1754191 RepID=A0A1Y1V0B1_9FUNG|nr:hypothetical protein BCR36DRAFT_334567 [Piromyces finnis]|eukprot:ORX44528.1 hypothetical protein BCR36DRAFT_334567 [Piromyces finnis]